MLSRILYIPFVLLLIIVLYLTYEVDKGYSWWIIAPVVILAAIYFTSPEIDWWWYQRHLPEMNPKLEQIINEMIPFYAALPPEDKKRFQHRVELYVIANAFIAKGVKEDGVPPAEVKYFLATNVVQLTFGQEDYRLPKFERLVIYPAPFPSPQFPEQIHCSEMYAEDGVLIFAVDPLMSGIIRADEYNIGFHEYAQAYIVSYPEGAYAGEEELPWAALEQISGWSKKWIEDKIGLPEIDSRAVSIHHFFYFPKSFQALQPAIYARYRELFNLDLLQTGSPVVYRDKLGKI